MGGKASSTAASEKRSERCSSPGGSSLAAPCVVKFYNTDSQESCSLYNICKPNHETPRKFIPELIGTTFYQKHSHQGWLIILCNNEGYDYTPSGLKYGDCFLWNPATNERVELPTLLEYCRSDRRGYIVDCVLSSPPRSTATTNPDNGNNDSMVLFFYSAFDEYTFIFCRPGDTEWRIHELSPYIADLISQRGYGVTVLYFKGRFYVMCRDYPYQDEHIDYHLEIEHSIKDTDVTISVKLFHVKKEFLFPSVGGKSKYRDSHYVESHDELFRVDLIYTRRSERVSTEVVRLNFSVMEWEKVNSLGDHVLFVGNCTTGCCSAADLGFTSGCLYYFLFECRGLCKFQIESTGNTITLPCLKPTEQFACDSWVIMHVNLQGRVLENMLGKDEENGILTSLEIETSNAGQVEVVNYWNNLNEDIVGVIANHLHGSDYKHFRAVCKENRAILPKVAATSYLSPWLVFSREHNYTIYNVINPMYNDETYSINLSDLADYIVRYQKGGWLLMTKKENIFFYNPFTLETVKLPDMDRSYCYSIISFSSLPTSSDCIVFAMDEWSDPRSHEVYIDFIKRGEAHWSSRIFYNTKIEPFLNTAVFHHGAFFCVGRNATLGVFSAEDACFKVLEKPQKQFDEDFHAGFLVECAGDLLLVLSVNVGCEGTSIRIFKLNFSEMKWVKVESLGEHMLFISNTSCLSAVAPTSHMKNKIYFPRLHLNGGGIMFYSLETGSYHSIGSQHSAEDLNGTEGWFTNCTWIEPNRLKSTTEELDWIKTPCLENYSSAIKVPNSTAYYELNHPSPLLKRCKLAHNMLWIIYFLILFYLIPCCL